MSADEVGKMLKAKNNNRGTKKPKINMTTRGQSRREVIIPMAKSNAELIVNSAHIHISNINKCLKNSKSNIIADFIRYNTSGIIITTNTPTNDLDLSTIENYLKNVQNVNPDSIESPRLPKSKSYMKIVRLPYSSKSEVMSPDIIKGVLKNSHLFKDASLASKPHVINVKIVEGRLCSFLFFLFYFSFSFFFYSPFLFLEQLRLGVISHTVTSVTT